MLPREHGAWGLLLQPFLAGAVLAGLPAARWIPAVLLLLAGLGIRTPLLELARENQRQNRDSRKIRLALVWAACEAALLGACMAWLWQHLTPAWRAGLLAGGALFTLFAVAVGLRNRQRSRLFQTASASVLALAAPFAVQLARDSVPGWGWTLWLVFLLQGACSIQLVHQRLERRVAARNRAADGVDARGFLAVAAVQVACGAVLALWQPLWSLPPVFSSGFALAEWASLWRLDRLREPLTRVGWRLVALSTVHLLLTVAAFWRAARAGAGV